MVNFRLALTGGGRHSFTSASGLALDDRGQRTSEGNTVWLYEPNGGPAQAWLLADPAIPRTVDDGPYRLATALDDRMAVSASASGCSLSSDAGALHLERDGATGLYRISSGGLLLTESGNRAVLAEADGSASQLWRVSALGGVSVNLFFTSFAKQARRLRKGGFTGCANAFLPIPVTA